MPNRDFAGEQAYLATVLDFLRGAIARAEASLDGSMEDLARQHEHMWASGRHVVRDLDDAVELLSHNRMVDMETRSRDIRTAEWRGLLTLRERPYFARIDFFDEKYDELVNVYIGRRALVDEAALDFYVYDWRSPIASMFYDFDVGSAGYESPGGPIQGDLRLKRQFRITNGQLRAMMDANALVRDELLGEILSQSAGHSLKVIAESIQRGQNAAIRFLAPRHMLVMGPAGSGKTSVGLHHVAYLLYHHRHRLSAQDVVAVSANHAFNAYIAGILPELYEADIRREVFSEIIGPLLPNGFRVATLFDQVEYLLSAPKGDSRAAYVARLYAPDFIAFLRQYLDDLPIRVDDLRLEGETVLPREALERLLDDGQRHDYKTRLLRVDRAIRLQFEDYFIRHRPEIKAGIERRAAAEELDLYTDREVETYVDNLLESSIAGHRRAIRAQNRLSATAQLPDILRAYARTTGEGAAWHRELRGRIERRFLHYEDALALLCVRAHMGLIAPRQGIRHVLIDEAQDYGALQHTLLRALFPAAAFTLLADTNQAMLPSIGIADGALFTDLYGERIERFPLEKSYRSTGPIGALCASLIAHRQRMTYYEREGPKPTLRRADDPASAVVDLLAQEKTEGTTAIIVRTRAAAEALFARIGQKIGARLVTEDTDLVDADLVILPVVLAKGLEFDRVIALLRGDEDGLADPHNTLYLYCTRALHRLHIVCEGAVPEALRGSLDLLEETHGHASL